MIGFRKIYRVSEVAFVPRLVEVGATGSCTVLKTIGDPIELSIEAATNQEGMKMMEETSRSRYLM